MACAATSVIVPLSVAVITGRRDALIRLSVATLPPSRAVPTICCATKLYLFGGALSKATLWLVRREPQMVHPPSHDPRTGEDLCPPPPGRWRRLVRRNSHCRLPSFVDCRLGIRSLRAGSLGFGSCLCFCRECDHVFDSGALPARVFRSVLLPPGPPGLG